MAIESKFMAGLRVTTAIRVMSPSCLRRVCEPKMAAAISRKVRPLSAFMPPTLAGFVAEPMVPNEIEGRPRLRRLLTGLNRH